MNYFYPDVYQKSIYTINYDKLKENGIKCLLFDLDNTCVPYVDKKPTKKLKNHFDKLKDSGFTVIIFSNSPRNRLEPFKKYLNVDCCFVGIHTGTLGFYTDYQIDEVDQFIKDVTSRQFKTMKRYMLEIKINKKDSFQTYYALNELRLDQGLQAQVIHVYIGNVLLEVFRGNGLCVSTPSGSTAYNKSLDVVPQTG